MKQKIMHYTRYMMTDEISSTGTLIRRHNEQSPQTSDLFVVGILYKSYGTATGKLC